MSKTQSKSIFVCQQCGHESPKWLGRCPGCNQWNTLVEELRQPKIGSMSTAITYIEPQALSRISTREVPRIVSPYKEFNRVMGGGIVPGSMALIGGDPGIGKSTLLLQIVGAIASEKDKVLYASGEESLHQIKLRAERLGIDGSNLYLLADTDLERILQAIQSISPRLAVIDSIQTVSLDGLTSSAGSVAQVRECTNRLTHWAKSTNVSILITGHVTKDGAIAGPRFLEHMVDVVLYLEGEAYSSYRLLRGVKNRFGSTNEVGVFEMDERGLVEVDDPSQAFLAERAKDSIGSSIVPTLEGMRPLLVEIQALTSFTNFSLPRRVANGVDFNRLLLITAILTKRTGLPLSNQDIIANVAGGLKVAEPAADLGLAVAIASSFRDKQVDPELTMLGEVGLSGELRAITQPERRLAEAANLGFRRCLLPRSVERRLRNAQGIEVVGVSTLAEALKIALQ